MSKEDDKRRGLIENAKRFLIADTYMLKINDAAVRVLSAFIGSVSTDELIQVPRWLDNVKAWQDVMVTSKLSQSNISLLIHKDVRSVRNAIRVLEKSGYITRLPHKAGEAHVTRIHADKIVSDSLDAYQRYQWSL